MNFIAVLAEFMESETKKYEMGKRWLAKMMGADIETFTDSDVEVRLNINEFILKMSLEGERLLERDVYQRGVSISKFHITTLNIQNIHTILHKCSHNVVKYRRNLIFLKINLLTFCV